LGSLNWVDEDFLTTTVQQSRRDAHFTYNVALYGLVTEIL